MKPAATKYGEVEEQLGRQTARLQALRLRTLAEEAYKPNQYATNLSFEEADRRIVQIATPHAAPGSGTIAAPNDPWMGSASTPIHMPRPFTKQQRPIIEHQEKLPVSVEKLIPMLIVFDQDVEITVKPHRKPVPAS